MLTLPILSSKIKIDSGKGKSVSLLIPPSLFLLDERVFMSLGVLKVASSLESAGYKVNVIDTSGISNYLDVVESYTKDCNDIAIGITTTTPQLPAVKLIIERIRSVRPDLKIILGGPHITLVDSARKMEVKQKRADRAHRAFDKLQNLVDVLVSGDGEYSIFTALRPDSPKLIDADDHKGEYFMDDEVYEASPYPARHLVDAKSYKYMIDGKPSTSLIAQLGCPFACAYCGGRNSKSLRMIRTRSSESIIKEIKFLHETYGHTGFMFYDDELNVNKGLVDLMNKISDLQSELGVDFSLRGFIKSELFNEEQASSMYRAGFRWLLCGFEAADPRILTNIQKRATVEDNDNVMDIANKYDLKVKALMSIGHAGESENSIRAVHDWLIKSKPADFDCTVITTYPGTPYYDEAYKNQEFDNVWTYTSPRTGDRLHAYDVDFTEVSEYYKGDPNGGYKSYTFTDHLSSEQIVELRNWVESDVRLKLNIPFNHASPSVRYEHSMGQSNLPDFILRSS